MNISYQFQKFVFGVVLPALRQPDIVLQIDNPRFKFRPSAISKESMRELLKHLDFDYPRDDNGCPLSYTKLDSKQMMNHIMWIEMTASNSNVTFGYIEKEWERIMASVL